MKNRENACSNMPAYFGQYAYISSTNAMYSRLAFRLPRKIWESFQDYRLVPLCLQYGVKFRTLNETNGALIDRSTGTEITTKDHNSTLNKLTLSIQVFIYFTPTTSSALI